jgi:hypothetical protein
VARKRLIQFIAKAAFEWGVRAFGSLHMHNVRVRSLRAAEELVELCQCYDVDPAVLHKLIDVVYSRPRETDDFKEIGGSLMTLLVLCHARGVDPEHALQTELLRVLSKSPEHFAKRNQEKIDLGLNA